MNNCFTNHIALSNFYKKHVQAVNNLAYSLKEYYKGPILQNILRPSKKYHLGGHVTVFCTFWTIVFLN